MKTKKNIPNQQQQAHPGTTRSLPNNGLTKTPVEFSPSPDEVARRAYFCYENEGSLPGRDVQHWLKAEADLLAERKLTRTHGFHNQT